MKRIRSTSLTYRSFLLIFFSIQRWKNVFQGIKFPHEKLSIKYLQLNIFYTFRWNTIFISMIKKLKIFSFAQFFVAKLNNEKITYNFFRLTQRDQIRWINAATIDSRTIATITMYRNDLFVLHVLFWCWNTIYLILLT